MSKPNKLENQKHLLQAEENEKLAKALTDLDSCYKDWVITLCFYSGLHYIYSKMPLEKLPKSHKEAEPLILKHCGGNAYNKYRYLSDLSRNARYYPKFAEKYRKGTKMVQSSIKKLYSLKNDLGV